jgi:hypothetical protein
MGTSMLRRSGREISWLSAGVRRHIPGEVVLFLRDGRLFAHRVMRASGSQLITVATPARPRRADAGLGSAGVVVEIIRDGTRSVPARPPSAAQRMAALAIRRSGGLPAGAAMAQRADAAQAAPSRNTGAVESPEQVE